MPRHGSPHWRRPYERLHVVPVTLRDAWAFVDAHHRQQLRGVAVLGRPVARRPDNGSTIEVTRVATDGCRNACSALYDAAARIARALGYARALTYTLASETGTSVRAAGWQLKSVSCGGAWSRHARTRRDLQPLGPKRRWEIDLGTGRAPDRRTTC